MVPVVVPTGRGQSRGGVIASVSATVAENVPEDVLAGPERRTVRRAWCEFGKGL
jgi:hypothetical protein